ncbi:hypothetical protein FGIG_07618 [Fasciola gigantica]|uniref:Uncharacterized protein n=1 Tax=Fasciola gigantica TaxID=46835 RepID=A0A504XQ29_FASGI|nr:hypothetical protein FGIG_07618 [Fasciola gigantica]
MPSGRITMDTYNNKNRVFLPDISFGSSLDLCGFAPFPSPSSTDLALGCYANESPTRRGVLQEEHCHYNGYKPKLVSNQIVRIDLKRALPVANQIAENRNLIDRPADAHCSVLRPQKKSRDYLQDNVKSLAQDPINKTITHFDLSRSAYHVYLSSPNQFYRLKIGSTSNLLIFGKKKSIPCNSNMRKRNDLLVASIHFLQKWNASVCRVDVDNGRNIQRSKNNAERGHSKLLRDRTRRIQKELGEESRKRRDEDVVQAIHEKTEFSEAKDKNHEEVRRQRQAVSRRKQEIARCDEHSLHLSNRMIYLTSKPNLIRPEINRTRSGFSAGIRTVRGGEVATNPSDCVHAAVRSNNRTSLSLQTYPTDYGTFIPIKN